MPPRRTAIIYCLCAFLSCTSHNAPDGDLRSAARRGDEIVVCGRYFHTGARVITWADPDGYDAYRTAPVGSNPAGTRRYNGRFTAEQLAPTRGVVTPALLRDRVDQFVLHYDACGTSRQCFHVLQDVRGLSVHFMLDVDGTIYQTLDLEERAWHATTSNTRSVGIEIANVGAFEGPKNPLGDYYRRDPAGRTRLVIPVSLGSGKFLHVPGFVGRPARDEAVVGQVQGQTLRMYDLTPQQYDSLVKLTGTLCTIFPKIRCDYPRGTDGQLLTRKLPDAQLAAYQGVLGHYHIQAGKTDPGPAMQWDVVTSGARAWMSQGPRP